MADYGLKIAKDGHDISEADKYMRVHTKYPVLKLALSGEGTLNTTSGGGGATAEITHNLGYKPVVFVAGQWIKIGQTTVQTNMGIWNRFLYQGLQVGDYYYYYLDNTKLYIVVSLCYLTDVNDYSFDYMYHIFYDEDTLA